MKLHQVKSFRMIRSGGSTDGGQSNQSGTRLHATNHCVSPASTAKNGSLRISNSVTDLMQWHMNLLVVTVGLQYCAETDSH
jgi:hypothetical protein